MKKIYRTLIASLELGDRKDLPEWFTLFAEGTGELDSGEKYQVTKNAFDLVKAKIDKRGIEIVFDYEHQTLAKDKAPAAGWCKDWRWTEGVGIEAKIDWTEDAAASIAKLEYRYYSPVFYVQKSSGLLCGVHSVALTNAPRTNHLKPLLAKLGAEPEEENDMLKLLIAALGLAADANEGAVVAAVKKLAAQKPKEVVAKTIIDALGIEESDESTVVASIHALKQTTTTMVSKSDFDALQARLDGQDAQTIVAKAMADGKITPDQKDWATTYAKDDLKGFETFVAKAPVVIPVKALPEGDNNTTLPITDEAVLQVAKMMDVDTEDLKTYGGLTA